MLTKVEDPQAVRDMVALVNSHAVDAFPDARVTAKTLENGPPVGDPLQIRLYGEDMTTLYDLRDQLMAQIRSVGGTYDVRDDWGEWSRQLSITPDPVRAARLGLSTSDVADALSWQFTGNVVTHFRGGDRNVPVTLRTSGAYRNRPDRLPDVPVFGSDAGVVPLGTVADIDLVFSPGSILRENTLRVMTIKGRVHGRFASDALAEIRPLVDGLVASDEWPVGYRIEFGGEQENSQEANGSIGAAMPISLSILSLILISQFNSIRRFVIIICTIPPMLIGVTPGLLLTGSSFGFMTMLGLIALLGIIVNNAILLIDEIDTQRDSGLPIVEAIVASCRSRLRPIIMTTCTTIIGLGPLAVAGGAMWSSMAWAMMFGLGFATLLTLMLCPVLFYLFFRRQEA